MAVVLILRVLLSCCNNSAKLNSLSKVKQRWIHPGKQAGGFFEIGIGTVQHRQSNGKVIALGGAGEIDV